MQPRRVKIPDQPGCDLYRAYDALGQLLYIGISFSALARGLQHKKSSVWFHLMAELKVEKYANRAGAIAAEQRAIIAEKPIFNTVFNGKTAAANAALEKRKLARRIEKAAAASRADESIRRTLPAEPINLRGRPLNLMLFTPEERKRILSALSD